MSRANLAIGREQPKYNNAVREKVPCWESVRKRKKPGTASEAQTKFQIEEDALGRGGTLAGLMYLFTSSNARVRRRDIAIAEAGTESSSPSDPSP